MESVMGYPQFSLKFKSEQGKLSQHEIDAIYLEYFNRGISYVAGIEGPIDLESWLKREYKRNGIEVVE